MERPSKMVQRNLINNYLFYLAVLVICGIYLFLRLSFQETIEFGYDQPRLASRIVEYIENGKWIDTQKFAEKSPWGNITWGPSLFFFYTPFFLISRDPLLISNLIALFNLLSILLVIFVGEKYFSKTAGLIAGLLLATQPWWFVFSRMIYQPTPLITIISISMLLYFLTFKKPYSIWWSLLIFSWIFLIELYAHSIAFVGISFLMLFIFKNFKLINIYLFLGVVLSTVLIIPYFCNFNKSDYFPEKNIEKLQDGRDDYLSRIKNITGGYLSVVSGGSFEYQLGNGYEDFTRINPEINILTRSVIYLTLIVFLYNLTSLFFVKQNRFIKLSLILWSVTPIIFLTLVRLPSVPPIPRYFLISLPAIVLLWGILVSELRYKIFVVVPLVVAFFWLFLIYKYNSFIRNYDFPNGHLSTYSDTQYIYVKKSIEYVLSRSNNFTISNDINNSKVFATEWGYTYLLDNVYKIDRKLADPNISDHYLIDYSASYPDENIIYLKKFGPISVYQAIN